MPRLDSVIVVGAGPSGLVLALLLAQRGISVKVLESGSGVDQRPRGLAYGPPATQVLRRAGVIEEIRSRTWDLRSMSWRKLDGEALVEVFDMDDKSPDRFVLYPVHMLSNLLLERLLEQKSASVHMSHPVIACGQDNEAAWVEVELSTGVKRVEADIVVGCDGGSSAVRKALYGEEFPGFTWDKQLVVTNVRYDMNKFDYTDAQWIVDPENWGMICGISKTESTWRVVYGEELDYTHDQLRDRLPDKFKKILPGHPDPDEYEILRFSPFMVHQRCVDHMRVGRVLLVADAAHLCNPMGGLGLTGGLSDVGSLIDCLLGIHEGKADMDILDKWDEVRRGIYQNIINPLSSANLQRLWKDPEVIRYTDPGFNLMRQAASNPEMAKRLQLMDIAYDMTQHYNAVTV